MRKHEGLCSRSDEVGSRLHLGEKANGCLDSVPLKKERNRKIARKTSLEKADCSAVSGKTPRTE